MVNITRNWTMHAFLQREVFAVRFETLSARHLNEKHESGMPRSVTLNNHESSTMTVCGVVLAELWRISCQLRTCQLRTCQLRSALWVHLDFPSDRRRNQSGASSQPQAAKYRPFDSLLLVPVASQAQQGEGQAQRQTTHRASKTALRANPSSILLDEQTTTHGGATQIDLETAYTTLDSRTTWSCFEIIRTSVAESSLDIQI